MDEPRQVRLFAESPGRISPPESGLYLGTSGWSHADWEGTLYPEGLPAGARLAEYAKHCPTVEIDSTCYGAPVARRWRSGARSSPRGSSSPPSSRTRVPHR